MKEKEERTLNKLPTVKVIGTGGSIAMIGRDRLDLTEYGETGKMLSAQELLDRIPEALQVAQVEVEHFRKIKSHAITTQDWLELSQLINGIFKAEPKVAGVAVTHGTNTLEETAYFLNLTVKSDKPVVVVGAQRPPSAISSDTEINLLDAIRVAACPEARGKGVLVVMNQEINAAREVTKSCTLRLDTFTSRDLGFLGYADADGRVVFYRAPTRKHTFATEFDIMGLKDLPRVDIIYSYGGADGTAIDALVERGARGLIVAGTGDGAKTPAEGEALDRAKEKGVVVVECSRVGSGRVVPTSRRSRSSVIAGDNLLPQKARVLLMLALAKTGNVDEIQRMFLEY